MQHLHLSGKFDLASKLQSSGPCDLLILDGDRSCSSYKEQRKVRIVYKSSEETRSQAKELTSKSPFISANARRIELLSGLVILTRRGKDPTPPVNRRSLSEPLEWSDQDTSLNLSLPEL